MELKLKCPKELKWKKVKDTSYLPVNFSSSAIPQPL